MTDMEGVAGTFEYDSPRNKNFNFAFKRLRWGSFLTREVNAAVEALLSVGIGDITVCDGHGPGDLLDLEKINPEVKAIVGKKRISWLPAFNSSFDALLFIGSHAMEGIHAGTLSHTYSRRTIKNFSLNNKILGEIGITAALAGYHSVPFIFISGDKAAIGEAREYVPNIYSVCVKEGISTQCTKTIHIKKSENLIKTEVIKSIKNYKSIDTFRIDPPFKLVVRYKRASVALYKWLRKKSNRPKFAWPNKLVFSHQNDLDILLKRFKEV